MSDFKYCNKSFRAKELFLNLCMNVLNVILDNIWMGTSIA